MDQKRVEATQAPPPYTDGYGQQYPGYTPGTKYGDNPPSMNLQAQPGIVYGQPTQSHIVYVNTPMQPPPPDNMAYAIFVTFCCCWPIGAFAIIRSLDSRRAFQMGDIQNAQLYGQRSRTVSNWALGVGIVVAVLSMVAVGLYIGLYVIPHVSDFDN